jgi:hypothetical protein
MTSLQRQVLMDCAFKDNRSFLDGLSANLAVQQGRTRQVSYLLGRKMIRLRGGALHRHPPGPARPC